MAKPSSDFGCLIAAIIIVIAAAGWFKIHLISTARERANSLTPLVRTDWECEQLSHAQLAIDMGNSDVANRILDSLEETLKENR